MAKTNPNPKTKIDGPREKATAPCPIGPQSSVLGPQPTLRNAGIVDVTFGAEVTVVQPVNLYGCTIGDGCFIGPFVEIQRSVTIGARCRIQSHAFICEL